MNPGAHLLNRLAPSLLHLAQQCTKSFIPIRRLYAEPIEEMPTQAKYDLLVMVNVLEHCYDAPQVFRNILEIITRGGILVFHDKLYQHDQVEQEVDSSFDAAHPLRVDRTLIHAFLQEHFSVLSTNIVHKVDRRTWIEEDHEGDDLYFIGTRRSGLESR
jgi:SAM-dependent methyltransferase